MDDSRIMVTKREAARLLAISVRTLTDWMRRGLIPYVKIGRRVLFSVEVLRAWGMQHSVAGVGCGVALQPVSIARGRERG